MILASPDMQHFGSMEEQRPERLPISYASEKASMLYSNPDPRVEETPRTSFIRGIFVDQLQPNKLVQQIWGDFACLQASRNNVVTNVVPCTTPKGLSGLHLPLNLLLDT